MRKPNQATKSDLASTLEQIGEIAEESLDPELSREDLVRRMKDIADLLDMDDDSDEEDDDEDED